MKDIKKIFKKSVKLSKYSKVIFKINRVEFLYLNLKIYFKAFFTNYNILLIIIIILNLNLKK